MTVNYKPISIFRHGINNDNIGPLAKASFEETPEMFLKAAKHGELDNMRGISGNVMCGQQGYYGTSSFQVLLDIDNLSKFTNNEKYSNKLENYIDKNLLADNTDPCSIQNISINSTIEGIKAINMGDNDYNPGF